MDILIRHQFIKAEHYDLVQIIYCNYVHRHDSAVLSFLVLQT